MNIELICPTVVSCLHLLDHKTDHHWLISIDSQWSVQLSILRVTTDLCCLEGLIQYSWAEGRRKWWSCWMLRRQQRPQRPSPASPAGPCGPAECSTPQPPCQTAHCPPSHSASGLEAVCPCHWVAVPSPYQTPLQRQQRETINLEALLQYNEDAVFFQN